MAGLLEFLDGAWDAPVDVDQDVLLYGFFMDAAHGAVSVDAEAVAGGKFLAEVVQLLDDLAGVEAALAGEFQELVQLAGQLFQGVVVAFEVLGGDGADVLLLAGDGRAVDVGLPVAKFAAAGVTHVGFLHHKGNLEGLSLEGVRRGILAEVGRRGATFDSQAAR